MDAALRRAQLLFLGLYLERAINDIEQIGRQAEELKIDAPVTPRASVADAQLRELQDIVTGELLA